MIDDRSLCVMSRHDRPFIHIVAPWRLGVEADIAMRTVVEIGGFITKAPSRQIAGTRLVARP
jgi:hypothetical protein